MSFRRESLSRALLLGEKLQHSLSPTIHQKWMDRYGVPGEYKSFELKKEQLEEFFVYVRHSKVKGMNVTMPYKIESMKYLDSVSEAAQKIGAVNTITNNKGRLHGDNTDYYGVATTLDKLGVDKKEAALVFGTGGAAQVVVYSLVKRGYKKIYVAGRSDSCLKKIKEKYPERIETIAFNKAPLFIDRVELVVNATPLGMETYKETFFSSLRFRKNAKVFDLVYNPTSTGLLRGAASQNVDCCNGLLMLYTQAAHSFFLWFGVMPELNLELAAQ